MNHSMFSIENVDVKGSVSDFNRGTILYLESDSKIDNLIKVIDSKFDG